MPSANGLLVMTINSKTKYIFFSRPPCCHFNYTKNVIVFKFRPKLSALMTSSFSSVRVRRVVIADSMKLWSRVASIGITFVPNFVKICQKVDKLKWGTPHSHGTFLGGINFQFGVQPPTHSSVRATVLRFDVWTLETPVRPQCAGILKK
jgi:hypothetical protein